MNELILASPSQGISRQRVRLDPFERARPSSAQIKRTRIKYVNKKNARVVCLASGDKGGLKLLEWSGKLVPQGPLVKTAKMAWKQVWLTFMQELAPQSQKGEYKRPTYQFNGRIGDAEFPVEPGRYAILVGNPCPWCHRVIMMLQLRGLDKIITSVKLLDDPERASRGGWVLQGNDTYFGAYADLRQVYDDFSGKGKSYIGRCTAPLVVDMKQKKIVSNESSEILKMLNDIYIEGTTRNINLRPADLVDEIDSLNAQLFDKVNNGVYKCGFATTQAAYDEAYKSLYESLSALDHTLSKQRFLLGNKFTEADLRLFPTAVRFDAVYATLFKCTKRWSDYPNLTRWLHDCAQIPLASSISSSGKQDVLANTVDIDDCRRSYFLQLFPLNPGGIIPGGPTAADILAISGQDKPLEREYDDIFVPCIVD